MDVLGISGSLRKESTNTKALNIALRFAREAGAAVRAVDLAQMTIPIYSEDIKTPPQDLLILQSVLFETDVILIASPEYNHSIPGGLKNVLDWLSVMENPLNGKVAAVFGVSNGPFGYCPNAAASASGAGKSWQYCPPETANMHTIWERRVYFFGRIDR